ncbi:MAG: S-layer homology domain-containing protein [Clostridia bacterium]|nr:S-layer homology domain-containing protein [Clostridia bacterium]
MKKLLMLISLCLAAAMILSVCAFAADGDAALPFRDVGAGEWYCGNVKYVYENGIMKGTSDTEFSPDGTLTRAMCVTILHRVAGEPTVNVKLKFTDVAPGEYYEKPVIWAFARGIVKGRTENEFVPDGTITRAEFATILYRYMNSAKLILPETKNASPSDAAKIESYAKGPVETLYTAEVIAGKGGGVFDPDNNVTRAETAAMIERFLSKSKERPLTGNDDVLDIAFFGNSFVYVPRTPAQFRAIAGDKHKVKTYDNTSAGYALADHYDKWCKRSPELVYSKTKDWDVVVLNEGADAPSLQIIDEFTLTYEFIKEQDNRDFETLEDYYEEYCSHYDYTSGEYYKLLVDIIGRGKRYYNLCSSSIQKNEEGIDIVGDGFFRDYPQIYPDTGIVGHRQEMSNKLNFTLRDWLLDNCDISRIMLNCSSFDPDNPLDPRDFDYMPDDFHPNLMYGYCFALALYCTIYDEPCIEQNNGLLTDDDIPGDTVEEKEAYMIMIKNMVQEQLDFQNSH